MMKNTVKQYLTALLLLSVAGTALFSCGDTDTYEETQPSDSQDKSDRIWLDSLEDKSFGKEFNFLVRESRIKEIEGSSEDSGDVLSEALYRRDAVIEERFGVEIGYITVIDNREQWNSLIDQDVMGNVGAYDAVMPDYWYGCETRFQFIDLNDYTHIMDFSKPWWYKGWNKNAEIEGQLYTAVGSMNLDTIRNTIAIYVNSNLADANGLPDMFELVYDGKWTLDKFIEFAAEAVSDDSGNGKIGLTEGDTVGAYLGRQQADHMWINYGVEYTSLNEDGEWSYDGFVSERTVDVYNKVVSMWKNDAFYFGESMNEEDYTINTESANAQSAFMNDDLLFFGGQLRSTEQFRDMKGDFTIIPFPKYDEEQEDYVSGNFGVCYFAIPVSAKDPVMSATILEAINAESYRSVVPAYYENALKVKYTRDGGETAEMLDFITERVHFDFGMVNHASLGGIKSFLAIQLYNGNESITSAWESQRSSYEGLLDKLLESYAEMAE